MTTATHGQVQFIKPGRIASQPGLHAYGHRQRPRLRPSISAHRYAVDQDGNIAGRGDIAAQTEQIFKNIGICLEAASARPEHLVHWSIYVAQGQDMRPPFEAGLRWWGRRPNPPMNNVMYVAGFSPADVLISIDALAIVPLEE